MFCSVVAPVTAAGNNQDDFKISNTYNVTMHVNETEAFYTRFRPDPILVYDLNYLKLTEEYIIHGDFPDKDGYYNEVAYEFKALKEGQTTLTLGHYERNGGSIYSVTKVYNITIIP